MCKGGFLVQRCHREAFVCWHGAWRFHSLSMHALDKHVGEICLLRWNRERNSREKLTAPLVKQAYEARLYSGDSVSQR
jgi:hypothetical protein